MIKVKNIWIEAEHWNEGEWNPLNDNSDVIVTCSNGDRYCATFFTYSNISRLVEKNQQTGECLNGKYFWASDMILIDNCSRLNIEEVVYGLIKNDEFESIFKRIE